MHVSQLMFPLQFDPQHGAPRHHQNLTRPETEPSRTQWWHYNPSKSAALSFSAWMKQKIRRCSPEAGKEADKNKGVNNFYSFDKKYISIY